MSFLYSEEYDAYRIHVAKWVDQVVKPVVANISLERPFETKQEEDDFFQSIDTAGFTSSVPRMEDGSFDYVAFYILTEEVARASGAISLSLTHRIHVAEDISIMMSTEQKEYFSEYLKDAIGGISGGITEPSGGSNISGIQTTAEKKGGKWLINGRKIWISCANLASIMFVVCRTKEEGRPDGHGIFLIERKYGWEASPIPMMGLNRHPLCDVVFENVEVPEIAKLEPESALGWTKWMFLGGRAMLAAISVGLAQEAYNRALAYADIRVLAGKKIASFQLIQELLADMATDLACGRCLLYKAADTLMKKQGDAVIETSMAKMFCTEMAVRVTSNAIQIHGAMGLAVETEVERMFRDARMLTIPDGPTQLQKLLIGRELTGVSALKG